MKISTETVIAAMLAFAAVSHAQIVEKNLLTSTAQKRRSPRRSITQKRIMPPVG
jgi:hypothetical protein